MKNLSIDLGEYAIALRTARAAMRPKRTQAQLAAEIGIPAHIITTLEAGNRRHVYPRTVDQAKRIAKHLKFHVPYRGLDGGEQHQSAGQEEEAKAEGAAEEHGKPTLNGVHYELPDLVDPEIVAINSCNGALRKLADTESRESVLEYLCHRWIKRARGDKTDTER